MRILFGPMVGGRGYGPLTRCLAIAEEARRRGHMVHFLIPQAFTSVVARFDHQWTLAAFPKRAERPPLGDTWDDIATFLGLTDESFIDQELAIEQELIRRFRPDHVFIESNVTLPLTCIATQIPFSSTLSQADKPDLRLQSYEVKGGAISSTATHNKCLAQINRPPIPDLSKLVIDYASRIIVPTIPSLEPDLKNDRFRFVGHLLFDKLEYEQLPQSVANSQLRGIVVYAYLATSDLPDGVGAEILKTIGLMPDVTLLGIVRSRLLNIPNCFLSDWLPGGTLMSRASLAFHPGTANTMTLAIRHAVPQLMLPLADSERLYHSEKIAAHKAGMIIGGESAQDPKLLYEAILETVTGARYKQASFDLRDELRNFGGPAAALDLIENL